MNGSGSRRLVTTLVDRTALSRAAWIWLEHSGCAQTICACFAVQCSSCFEAGANAYPNPAVIKRFSLAGRIKFARWPWWSTFGQPLSEPWSNQTVQMSSHKTHTVTVRLPDRRLAYRRCVLASEGYSVVSPWLRGQKTAQLELFGSWDAGTIQGV